MDYICRRCGEPWDFHGIPRSAGGYGDDADSDMSINEGKLMMEGKGCPSCIKKDIPPDQYLNETLQSISDSDDPEELLENML